MFEDRFFRKVSLASSFLSSVNRSESLDSSSSYYVLDSYNVRPRTITDGETPWKIYKLLGRENGERIFVLLFYRDIISRTIILAESDTSSDNLESESPTKCYRQNGHYFSHDTGKGFYLSALRIPTTRDTWDSRDRSRIRPEKRNVWNSEE